MYLFTRFSFALAALCFFLATSVSGLHKHVILKREPDFIENWALYQRWTEMTDAIGDFDVPVIDGITLAEYDKGTKTLKWTCNTLVLGKQLAAGASAIHQATLDPYADPMIVAKRSYGERYQVIYGATMQKKCGDNENVLPVIDYVYQDDPTRPYGWLLMPYVSAGSLETNYGSYADQTAVNNGFKQILNAVAAVSSAGIIHRDLKPENFLVDGGNLKLMDFDQARETTSSMQYDVGTPSYIAPEIIAMAQDTGGYEYDTKADTFSIGMTFMVMSVPDLQDATNRFQLWKDLIEPNGQLWPSADDVATLLKSKNYPVFSGNDGLLKVIAKALCKPSERYDPPGFKDAFGGVA